MSSLEQEIRGYFSAHRIEFDDGSRSFNGLDFGFGSAAAKRYFTFDAKEKQQPYRAGNWPTQIPEPHLFIVDDLAARKALLHAPDAGLIVRDAPRNRYVFFSVIDLYLMPKTRVNRPINRTQPGWKGKWLIDLRNGESRPSLALAFAAIDDYLGRRREIFRETVECYGSFQDEPVGQGGIERRPEHWVKDFQQTR